MKIHAVCAVLRRGECRGDWCEHWIPYTGASHRLEPVNPIVPPEHGCGMLDDHGESMCHRASDRPHGESPLWDRDGDRRMDWFTSGYDEWSWRYFPSTTEFLVWTFQQCDRWDRREWRQKRYWRKVRGKQLQAARVRWRLEE